jgi:glycosyltransferase involved in cell wall biosynthesis
MAMDSLLSQNSIHIVTHSGNMERRITQSVASATEENITTLPAPTPDRDHDIPRSEAHSILGTDENLPTILFFGNHSYEKGPDLLAKSVREVTHPLQVIYAGPEQEFKSEDIDSWKQKSSTNIKIINRSGYVPENKVDTYFAAADCVVLPYRRKRGISGPLRRGCMFNTHIIGPEESDVGEIISSNNLGQLFLRNSVESLSEQIDIFCENINRYPSSEVKKYSKKQNWRTVGKQIEALYTELV